ncbi:uncharacterized protein A4U43_C04F10610 [Asparagus officinalis]|uniref:Death domain-containing protein n=2 Tax=Asparagus officinalis TaxID=4686 RepID=A0A5P1F1N7_ASPOF|nr:uncharacterized protein A4U43_C04F10610 [Asparagus officinalis]
MRERGYQRSPDQCKCKWKNLVNRYKGKETSETSDPDNGKHCPFFDELHAVFTERARNMQHLLESETSTLNHPQKKLKRSSGVRFSDEISDADDDNEESDDEQHLTKNRKKKTDKIHKPKAANNNVHELLQDFLQQQQRAEAQWRDLMERMGQERRMFEKEWQQSMEKLERERFMLERAWQEKEEQRRITEENRALKRDALLNTLLHKLIQEDL